MNEYTFIINRKINVNGDTYKVLWLHEGKLQVNGTEANSREFISVKKVTLLPCSRQSKEQDTEGFSKK